MIIGWRYWVFVIRLRILKISAILCWMGGWYLGGVRETSFLMLGLHWPSKHMLTYPPSLSVNEVITAETIRALNEFEIDERGDYWIIFTGQLPKNKVLKYFDLHVIFLLMFVLYLIVYSISLTELFSLTRKSKIMSLLIETTVGNLIVDLYTTCRPRVRVV